ncbi:MAG TPA: tetratricopeptide repeat protein [Ramlibacter sp.]|nr:tetratricopeptide repeat protein [Ramlibacter sp.]
MATATFALNAGMEPAERLQRLQGYLQQDPSNPALLAETFDAAVAAGRHEFAQGLLDAAQWLDRDAPEWAFRRARLCIATRDLAQAETLLEDLQRQLGGHPAVAHDLAWVAFLRGDMPQCRALLQPWLDAHGDELGAAPPAEVAGALQALWLRASHALRLVDAAWAWAWALHLAGRLQPAAQGVASLLAIDADCFDEARTLSDLALRSPTVSPEPLVARASVALAEGQTAQATALLERALLANPHDGRTWLTLGLTSLRDGRVARAQQQLERAALALGVHIGAWHALGWARLLQRDPAGAQAAFARALEIDGNFAESHGAMGLVLALAGSAEKAEHHLAVCDRLDARNVTGRYARAWLSGEAQDTAKLQALAARLFDRPGFFAGRLSDSVPVVDQA